MLACDRSRAGACLAWQLGKQAAGRAAWRVWCVWWRGRCGVVVCVVWWLCGWQQGVARLGLVGKLAQGLCRQAGVAGGCVAQHRWRKGAPHLPCKVGGAPWQSNRTCTTPWQWVERWLCNGKQAGQASEFWGSAGARASAGAQPANCAQRQPAAWRGRHLRLVWQVAQVGWHSARAAGVQGLRGVRPGSVGVGQCATRAQVGLAMPRQLCKQGIGRALLLLCNWQRKLLHPLAQPWQRGTCAHCGGRRQLVWQAQPGARRKGKRAWQHGKVCAACCAVRWQVPLPHSAWWRGTGRYLGKQGFVLHRQRARWRNAGSKAAGQALAVQWWRRLQGGWLHQGKPLALAAWLRTMQATAPCRGAWRNWQLRHNLPGAHCRCGVCAPRD